MTARRPPAPVFGLDFGMTTSSLAVVVGEDRPRLVEDPAVQAGGAVLIPTAVWLQQGDTFLVGTAALNARQAAPEIFKDQFKRYVDRQADTYFGRRPVLVTRIVAEVLSFLRGLATNLVPDPPARVVLTVPASWGDEPRGAMKDAADRAGFTRQSLILVDEPTAAFAYARTLPEVDDTRPVLIYDLGGSTFDCALLVPDDGSGQPRLFRDGLPRLGGLDFDRAILQDLTDRYPQIGRFRAEAPDQSPVLEDLIRSCERIKRRLSTTRHVEEKLVELPDQPLVTLSREQFTAMIASKIERTVRLCADLLAEAGPAG
jgi:molecular chaperone DnaK (HSP70)